nr:GNAT family N-acetyltransferase [Motilibacter aurantiacus]
MRPPYSSRRALPSDAEAAYAVAGADDERVLGHPDGTLADLRDDLESATLEAWLVEHPQAGPVGYATVEPKGDAVVYLDLYTVDPGLGPQLLAALTARGRELLAVAGELRTSILRPDERTAAWLEDAGWRRATSWARLRLELADPPPAPAPPGDVTVRRVPPGDEQGLRAVHGVIDAAFADSYGHVPEPFEEWFARLDARSTVDWSQVWLAETASGPVGALYGSDDYVEDEQAGYVARLGVLRAARGRGVARALLLTAFADVRARGLPAVLLHVDEQGTTGAYALYESVGMRRVLQVDAWVLPAG